jgi:citrate synthase
MRRGRGARAYGLPGDAPQVLFALGRTVGWIARAIEQYTSADLIRPRAHYTGPAPEVSGARPTSRGSIAGN